MLLTIPEVAEKLKVHANTVRKLLNERQLTPIQVGRQIRIEEADLEKFKQGKTLTKENVTKILKDQGLNVTPAQSADITYQIKELIGGTTVKILNNK